MEQIMQLFQHITIVQGVRREQLHLTLQMTVFMREVRSAVIAITVYLVDLQRNGTQSQYNYDNEECADCYFKHEC